MKKFKSLFLLLALPLSLTLTSCFQFEDVCIQEAPEVLVPEVGQNGNWWVGDKDTGVSVHGLPGEDGITPTIGENGNWWIGDVDTNIKATGRDGKPGTDGEDGISPHIGEDGFWYVGEKNTGIKAEGQDGKTPEVKIDEDGYWVLNGIKTTYKAEGNVDEIKQALTYQFDYTNVFVSEGTTTNRPSWNYTTSTFSGWGGSIGKPQTIDSLRIKVRARDKAIKKIKFFISENDKNGTVLRSEIIDINIPAYEDQEIIRKLPKIIENNAKTLYFSYNCDQFCDVYSGFGRYDLIPETEYQAISTYMTNGKILDDLSKMTDVYNLPCYYLYTEFGHIEHVYKLKENFMHLDKVSVNLAKEYVLTVDDNFQLFYRGVIKAVNPYNYCIEVLCDKGSAYPRYYEWKPTNEDLGRYELKINVYDNNGNLIGNDKTTLIVVEPQPTKETQNVLCFGDSLTAGGTWVLEAARRFTQTGGNVPGLGLDYLNFIGNKKTSINGKTYGYEGTGGWTWATYLTENSPFYNHETKKIDFKNYAKQFNIDKIDYCYILLTWNGMGKAFDNSFSINSGHFKNAQIILDQLKSDFPNIQIRLMGLQMPSQNGGMGTNYHAVGGYSNAYGMLVTAMNYNKTLEELALSNKYKDFVRYIDVAGQFDTDYNMPSTSKPVNNRNPEQEVIGTNGVHPSIYGYYQIADAAFRSFCYDHRIITK